MGAVRVTSKTQRIEVNPASSAVSIVNAGPPGPSGSSSAASVAAIDERIAIHNQSTEVHTNATSGRDFSAWYLNRLE